MKLLLDQNISYKLVPLLEEYFPESTHVKYVNLSESNDFTIWQFAKNNGYSIVTQDVDFAELAVIKGIPPKIIWLRIGNTTSTSIFNTLVINYKELIYFLNDQNSTCIQLF